MKFITRNGETLALLLARPDRTTHPRITATLRFNDVAPSLTHQESRRSYAKSARFTYEFIPRFRSVAEITEFRLGLNRLKDETLAAPLWDDHVLLTAVHNAGSTVLAKSSINPVRYGAEWIILDSETLTYEIVTVSDVGASTITCSALTLNWPAGTLMYPLFFGRFEERPKLSARTPSRLRGPVKLLEHSTFARRLNTIAGTIRTVGGTIAAKSAVPLWDIEPDWSELLDTTAIDIIYQQLGFLRAEQTQVYQQAANRRGLEMRIICRSRDAIAKVERLFMDRRGQVRTLMVPTFRNDLQLTQDLPISGQPNRIAIAASAYSDAARPAHPGDPYLALIDFAPPGAPAIEPQRVTNVAAGTLTTEQPIAAAHTGAGTVTSHLLLARFADDALAWTYSTPTRAMARLRFVEVPDEYDSPQADLPLSAYLYRFEVLVPSRVVLGSYTSHEQALVNLRDTELFRQGSDGGAGTQLVFQAGDGNLVLYTAGLVQVWSAQVNSPGATLAFQNDGNLVITSSTNVVLWTSGTSESGFVSGVTQTFLGGATVLSAGTPSVVVGLHSLVLVNGLLTINRTASYAPAPFSHGSISRTLTLDDKTDITSWGGNFPGNPLARFLPLTLEGDLLCTIFEMNADAPGDGVVEKLFYGKVKQPQLRGNDWKATLRTFDFIANSKYPRFLVQKSDNFLQFTRPTGLSAAAYAANATVAVIASFRLDVNGPAQAADWFSGGWILRGSGTAQEGRGILSSVPIAGVSSAPVGAGGSGYTSPPAVAFSGDGTGAAGTAVLTGGVVTGITITAAGSGYTYPPTVTLTGGGGTGATATAVLGATSGERLTLDRPFTAPVVGEAVVLYPGYTGSLAQCISKYNNRLNFGGHPFMPDTGPQIKAVDTKVAAGGKK